MLKVFVLLMLFTAADDPTKRVVESHMFETLEACEDGANFIKDRMATDPTINVYTDCQRITMSVK